VNSALALKFLAIFLLIVVSACSAGAGSNTVPGVPDGDPGKRPAWVTCPPSVSGGFVALGIAAARIRPEDTVEAACAFAVSRLARNLRAHVISASYLVSWQTHDYGEFATAADTPEGLEDQVSKSATVVDNWLDPSTNTGYCLAQVPTDRDDGGANPCSLPATGDDSGCGGTDTRPDWVDNPPRGKGCLFSVGTASIRAYQVNALDESIKDGMGKLSTLLSATVSGISDAVESATGTVVTAEQFTSSRTVLSGVQVTAWWLDPKLGDTHSLVCLPTAGVKVNLAAAVSKTLEEQAPPSQSEDPEEFHRTRLEKLRVLLDAEL